MENVRHFINLVQRQIEEEIIRLNGEIERLAIDQLNDSFMSQSISEVAFPLNASRADSTFVTPEAAMPIPDRVVYPPPPQQPTTHVGFQVQPPTIKIPFPTFTSANIEMWFWTVEKWFASMRVFDDDQRFSTVLLALPPQTVAVFKEQLDAPPSSGKYEFVKKLVIRQLSRNQFERIKALVADSDLGDRKPSELYAEMRQLAGSSITHAALKGLWILRLPEQMRPSLALSSDIPAEFLRDADLMFEVTPRIQVNTVAASTSLVPSHVANLAPQDDLQICAVSNKSNPAKGRHRLLDQSSKNPRNDMSRPGAQTRCFYHSMFGSKARKCRSPCSWSRMDPSSDV